MIPIAFVCRRLSSPLFYRLPFRGPAWLERVLAPQQLPVLLDNLLRLGVLQQYRGIFVSLAKPGIRKFWIRVHESGEPDAFPDLHNLYPANMYFLLYYIVEWTKVIAFD